MLFIPSRENDQSISPNTVIFPHSNILFRTTDTRYRPSWAVTTLLLPETPVTNRTDGKAALLSYQIPYNTADVDASPSYLLSTVLAQEFMGIPAYTDVIAEALGRGWYGEFVPRFLLF